MLAPLHHKPQGWTLKVGHNQRAYKYIHTGEGKKKVTAPSSLQL